MHNLGRWKAIERRAAGVGIGAYIFGIEQIAHIEVRELGGQGDGIKSVARRAENGADLGWTLLEALHPILAVIKNHAAISVIDAVVDVVAELAAAEGLANNLGDGRGGGGHQETPRLRQDCHSGRENRRQCPEA